MPHQGNVQEATTGVSGQGAGNARCYALRLKAQCVTNSARRANHFRFGENLSSPKAKNILLYRTPKSVAYADPFRPVKRGRIARSSRTSGRNAMDAAMRRFLLARRQQNCVRRSRVVLAPRPWRLFCGRYPADNGDKKRRSPGRARSKP